MMNPFDVFDKRHPFYHWIKFNMYKPIRNAICEERYRYDDEEYRKEFIRKIKNKEI